MRPLFVGLALLMATAARAADFGAPVVFAGVTVVNVESGRLLRNRTVVVTGPAITAISSSKNFALPTGATVVNATGKYLIPGLWDMHVHIPGTLQGFLDLYLANGVTGVREMNTEPQVMAWRNDIQSGRRRGPRIVAAGFYLDALRQSQPPTRPTANTPDQGRELVRQRKKEGADFIKVYTGLRPDVYQAVLDEAKLQGLLVAGHCPETVGAWEASRLGQRSIEHLTGIALSSCREEAAVRQELASAFASPQGYDFDVVLGAIAKAMKTPDEKRQRALFKTFVKNRTWQTPTLVTLRSQLVPAEPAAKPDPRMRYMHPVLTQLWDRLWRTPEARAAGAVQWKYAQQTVRAMHRAGVPLLAGTDAGLLTPNVFFGFAIADELELFVQCGLTPTEALRTATLNPALYLGEEKTSGTVAVGKRADLVLLNANPLSNINNVRGVVGVVANGKYLPEPELKKMLADIEAGKW